MKEQLLRLWQSVGNALLPRYCCVCGRRLLINERVLCVSCLAHLPLTNIKGRRHNIVERLLWNDVVGVERASSMLYYRPRSSYCNIYFSFKYQHQPQVAVYFGRLMAQELADTSFFNGIDCIVPIPLSRKRQKERGYNQSEYLAKGISMVTHLPIDTTSIQRIVDNPTQTQVLYSQRYANVRGIFKLISPERLAGKHVLIVDDMITTGSTTSACAREVLCAKNARVSVLSLGLSDKNKDVEIPQWRRK